MKRDIAKAIILIVVLNSLVYAYSLKNSFVLDDYGVIVQNDFVKSWKNFPKIFTKAYLSPVSKEEFLETRHMGSGEVTYRPIVTMTYFVDYSIWKLNPFGYHLFNLILHILNATLLYFFINLIAKDGKIALFSSLLFSLHPVNASAVNVITFREDLLVFLFFFLSFIFYVKLKDFKGTKWATFYCLSLFSFLLALFSKEMAVTLPILLVLYDYFFTERKGFFKFQYLGYLAVCALYLWIWLWFRGDVQGLFTEAMREGAGLWVNIITASRVAAIYIGWLFLPINIRSALPKSGEFTSYSVFEPAAFFSILLIITCIFIAIKISKKSKTVSFGMLWFFITLLPVSNIFPISNTIASRFLYIPAVGFCFLLALFLSRFPKRLILITILAFYSMFTVIRSVSWKNNIMLWQEFAERYPNSPKVHRVLGCFFEKEGLLEHAMREYNIAVTLAPDYQDARVSLQRLLKESDCNR